MENFSPLPDLLVMGCCRVVHRVLQKSRRVLQGCCRDLLGCCRVPLDSGKVGHMLHLHLCLERVVCLGTLQLWSLVAKAYSQ